VPVSIRDALLAQWNARKPRPGAGVAAWNRFISRGGRQAAGRRIHVPRGQDVIED
jgi:hypothetical protein